MKEYYKKFLLIARGAHENVYCNLYQHIVTEGGLSSPLKTLEDTKFKKVATKCDCPPKERKAYAGFIGFFLKDPKK